MLKSFHFLKSAIVLAILAALAAPASAGEIQQKLAQESAVEGILQRGVLRVGMSTFVPWAMKDKTGKLIGFEIDVAKRLAEDMGVKVEFVPTKWAGIIPALLTGKFDVIIGGMSVTPNRNLKVNFSVPYYYTGQSIVAHKEKAKGFKSLDDFNKSDVVIAARLGSTAVPAAKKHIPKAELRLFDDEAQAYQEVINGNAHAVVGSAPTPAYQAIKYPDRLFLPIDDTFTKEPIAFAIRKGDSDSLNYFNNWIRVTQAKEWFKERKDYWFGTRDWADQIQ